MHVMLNTPVYDDQHCSEVSSVCLTDQMLAVVKQEPPDEIEVQWSPATEATVKDEPPDDTEDYWESDDEDRPPIPLIDIVKCESTLIQTLDDGLSITQYRVEDTPPPVLLCRSITQKNSTYEPKSLNDKMKIITKEKARISTRSGIKSFDNKNCNGFIAKCDVNDMHFKIKPYECEKCQLVFRQIQHLQKHIRIYHTLKSFGCSMCDKAYYNKSHLSRHIRQAHENLMRNSFKARTNVKIVSKRYQCPVCKKVIGKSSFYKHKRLHAEILATKYKCAKCDKTFNRKGHLESHMKAHRGRTKYKCDACSLTFVRPSDLIKHNSNIHAENTDIVTSDIEKITQNLKKAMSGFKNLFKCKKCGRVFSQIANLRRHLLIVHYNIKPFKCGLCDWAFGQKRDRDRHMKRHKTTKQNRCHKCKMTFVSISDLKHHTLKSHSSKIPETPTIQHKALIKYKCDVCNLGFVRTSDLSKHRLKHDEAAPSRYGNNKQMLVESEAKMIKGTLEGDNTVRNMCQCNICGRKFSQMYNLKRHMLKLHRTTHPPKDRNRKLEDDILKYRPMGAGSSYENHFECNKCDRVFTYISNLRRHAKVVHCNIKSFKCGICDRAFGQKVNRDKHMKLHKETEQYKCSECKIQFVTISALNRHISKIHHNNKVPNLLKIVNKGDISQSKKTKKIQLPKQKQEVESLKQKHMKKRYVRPIKVCQCKKCGRVFSQNYTLKRHMLTVHLNIKLFKCGICDQAFRQEKNRDKHMILHSQCGQCKVTFKTVSDLEQHMRKSHSESESPDMNVHRVRTKYKCEECNLEFVRPTDLSKHKLTHKKTDPIQRKIPKLKKTVRKPRHLCKCNTCGRVFTQIYNLKRHMKTVHTNIKAFKCGVCHRAFEHKTDLDKHVKLHSTTKQHECYRCQMSLNTKSELDQHLKTHALSTIKSNLNKTLLVKPHEQNSVQKCNLCDKLFYSGVSLSNHMRSHKSFNRLQILQCSICKKILKTRRILRAHLKMHAENGQHKCGVCYRVLGSKYSLVKHFKMHKTTENIHKCEICKRIYTNKRSLKKHMGYHRSIGKHECGICKKVFRFKSSHYRHMKIHYKAKHECSICKRIFALKAHLEKHIKLHDVSVKNKCGVCNKAFLRASHLEVHALQHNRRTPLKCKPSSLQCPICFKKLGSKATLYKHKLTHFETDKYKCHICDKKFSRNDGLKRHLLTHTKEHKCGQCNKKFNSQSNLNMHKKVHHYKQAGEKKYKCSICNKGYNLKKCLDNHIKSHEEST